MTAASSFDVLEDFLEEPAMAARAALARRPTGLGLAGYAIGALSILLARAVLVGDGGFSTGLVSLALLFLWEASSGAVLAGVLHLAAEAALPDSAGAPQHAAGALFVLLGLSELAWTPLVPAALVARAFGFDGWLAFLALTAAAGWVGFAVKARCLGDIYGLSRGRAWTVLSAPYLAASMLAFAFGVLTLAGMALSLMRLGK